MVNESIEKQNFSNIFVSEAGRFDQNITKGKVVMIFSDSRTNPFEEGEDDKDHGVPNGSIAKKIKKM